MCIYNASNKIDSSIQSNARKRAKVYLDINKIKDGEQKEIEDPALTQIPDPYASYLHYQTLSEKYDFSKSGTLVIWKKCDRISPKTRGPLTERLFYLSRTYSDLIHDDRQINVFSKYKLEKHHIVPVGSVSKIGESTDILRKDKTNIVNSPLNYVFISDATNLEISNISLKEYEQDITASAKAALNIVNYPSVEKLNDKTTIKAWLKERYKILKGQIQNRVMNMLLS